MADAPAERHDPAGDVVELCRRIEMLEEQVRRTRAAIESANSDLDDLRHRPTLDGYATAEGCQWLTRRFSKEYASFYRAAGDLYVSTIGIGTSRGEADHATDATYVQALEEAMRSGINLIDTAINYRYQRAECAVGTAIRKSIASGSASRDALVVCSKGGYLVPGAFSPNSIPSDETEAGFHSISAPFLADQLKRSKHNLGLETIDVYYLHNPEIQLPFIGEAEFRRRIRAAFAELEVAVSDGHIRYYGVATWDGFYTGALSLPTLLEEAQDIAGDHHHFRFVQLPLNMQMQDAATSEHQDGRIVLEIAAEAGLAVIASASLGNARSPREDDGDPSVNSRPSPVLRALQYARSTPGVTSALVGMRRLDHVRHNLSIARIPPHSHVPA